MDFGNIEDIYYNVSLFSAIAILTLGVILGAVRFPESKIWNKTRAAHIYLAVSYLVLGAGNIIEYFHHSSADDPLMLLGITALISSFQALLFTATLLVFVQPSYVSKRRVLTQILLILACGTVIMSAIVWELLPAAVLFPLILALYLFQLTNYTMLFRRKYAACISTLEEYYDEEQDERLKWVKICFYLALSVGLLGITAALVGMWLYLIFIVLYTIFYTWTVIQFNDFRMWADAVVPVVSNVDIAEEKEPEVQEKAEKPAKRTARKVAKPVEKVQKEDGTQKITLNKKEESELKKHLESWVASKGYLKRDESVDDIAEMLGTDKNFLRYYFSVRLNTNFRSWRSELRIREAERLIKEHPEYSLSQIGEMTGFNHRGNFYIHFEKVTGIPATEYREKELAKRDR